MWPMDGRLPVVVAFQSFRGGVGQSTLLGVTAWQLASKGERVVCLDLNWAAPGLSALFHLKEGMTTIEHLSGSLNGVPRRMNPVKGVLVHGQEIGVIAAGRVTPLYIQKLAHLSPRIVGETPLQDALNVLLEQVRDLYQPTYILVDCPSGLPDRDGISLLDTAHIYVLTGRDTPHGRDGLAVALGILREHRQARDLRILVAQTMLPVPVHGEGSRVSRERFQWVSYEASLNTIYADLDDVPADNDEGAAHYPWPIGRTDEIPACEYLGDVSVATLQNDAYSDFRRRLEALAQPEIPSLQR